MRAAHKPLDIASRCARARRHIDAGDGDITRRRMLEPILAVEEEHARDLASLIQRLQSTPRG